MRGTKQGSWQKQAQLSYDTEIFPKETRIKVYMEVWSPYIFRTSAKKIFWAVQLSSQKTIPVENLVEGRFPSMISSFLNIFIDKCVPFEDERSRERKQSGFWTSLD